MAKNLINSNDIEVETLGSNLKLELSEEVHEQLDALDDYVVDSMAGNENNKAPSVRSVKDYVQDIYSTDEVKTNKIWIDNKPIYRKSIYINAFPNVAEKNVAHGITNISQILDIYGYATDGSRTFPLPFISVNITTGSASGSIYITANSTNVTLGTASNRSAFSGYVTLEYTKTTD